MTWFKRVAGMIVRLRRTFLITRQGARMMVQLKDRMKRLEVLLTPAPIDRKQIEEDAAVVQRKLVHIASSFSAADGDLSESRLLGMSPAQHFAWALRFAPDQADVGAIMAAHGSAIERRA